MQKQANVAEGSARTQQALIGYLNRITSWSVKVKHEPGRSCSAWADGVCCDGGASKASRRSLLPCSACMGSPLLLGCGNTGLDKSTELSSSASAPPMCSKHQQMLQLGLSFKVCTSVEHGMPEARDQNMLNNVIVQSTIANEAQWSQWALEPCEPKHPQLKHSSQSLSKICLQA